MTYWRRITKAMTKKLLHPENCINYIFINAHVSMNGNIPLQENEVFQKVCKIGALVPSLTTNFLYKQSVSNIAIPLTKNNFNIWRRVNLDSIEKYQAHIIAHFIFIFHIFSRRLQILHFYIKYFMKISHTRVHWGRWLNLYV